MSCVTLQPGVAAGAGALHVLPALAIKRVVLAFVSTVLSFLVFQAGMGGSGGSLVVHAIVYARVLIRVHKTGRPTPGHTRAGPEMRFGKKGPNLEESRHLV